MAHEITFAGKTYEFDNEFYYGIALDVLGKMKAANKVEAEIANALAGFGKIADKSEKFAFAEAFQGIIAQIRKDATIQKLVTSAIEQISTKSQELGVDLAGKIGNHAVADVTDSDKALEIAMAAWANDDVVTITFDNNDDGDRYARVAVNAKSALDNLAKAVNHAATNIVPEDMREKARVTVGDDWYPTVKAAGGAGGSAAGRVVTRYAKLTWNGQQYDGLKADVAKQLASAGMPTEYKKTVDGKERTVKLSVGKNGKPYYAKWLQQLNELGAFPLGADFYNKQAE